MNHVLSVSALLLSVTIIGFHSCAIYVCVTSKELKTVRFIRLALFLSLSGCAMGVEFFYSSILKFTNTNHAAYKFQCMMIRHVASGTLLSYLLHTVLICLERLNSTCKSKLRTLTLLTGNVSVCCCFILPHCLPIIMFGIKVSYADISCKIKSTVDRIVLFTHDIPASLLILLITVLYSIVIVRITKQQKTVGCQPSGLIENQIVIQMAKKKRTMLRMRRNIATLGMIIGLAVISTFPRIAVGLYANIKGSDEAVLSFIAIANNIFLLIKPLSDPIIYVFRVKKYREQLCACCLRPNRATNAGA